MKKKSLKRLAWALGLAFAVLLPLTVIPGLNYVVEGPWGTGIGKESRGYHNQFVLLFPGRMMGYAWSPGKSEAKNAPTLVVKLKLALRTKPPPAGMAGGLAKHFAGLKKRPKFGAKPVSSCASRPGFL